MLTSAQTSIRRLARGVLLAVALSPLAAVPTASAAPAADPFAVVKAPQQATLTHVGALPDGTRVALVLPAEGSAVAYACDGTGKVSTWFSGSFDRKAGTATLTGAKGAGLAFALSTRSATLTLDGKARTLSLDAAVGSAGLYRTSLKDGAKVAVLGWIAGNDGTIVGTGSVGGVPVTSITDGTSNTKTTPIVAPAAKVGISDAFVNSITAQMIRGPIYVQFGDIVSTPR